jgi:hypothetical protein
MRLFYEAWHPVFVNFSNRQSLTDDLKKYEIENRQFVDKDFNITAKTETSLDLGFLSRCIVNFSSPGFPVDVFFNIGFTHHSEILAKEKSLDGRLFYIARCAYEFWTVDTLKSYLRGSLYSNAGTIPKNFALLAINTA